MKWWRQRSGPLQRGCSGRPRRRSATERGMAGVRQDPEAAGASSAAGHGRPRRVPRHHRRSRPQLALLRRSRARPLRCAGRRLDLHGQVKSPHWKGDGMARSEPRGHHAPHVRRMLPNGIGAVRRRRRLRNTVSASQERSGSPWPGVRVSSVGETVIGARGTSASAWHVARHGKKTKGQV